MFNFWLTFSYCGFGRTGVFDGYNPVGVLGLQRFLRSIYGQNTIRRQRRRNLVDVVVGWQNVSPDEVPRDVTVFVLFFLMFSFNHYAGAGCLDGNLVGGELLDIQYYLEQFRSLTNRRGLKKKV